MSDLPPLDAVELVVRAKRHVGVDASDTNSAAAPTMGAQAEKLLIDAVCYHPAWTLPPEARLQALRKAVAAPLSVYTDRQNQLNADLLAAFTSLLADCQALEARVARLEVEVSRLSGPDEAGAGGL